MRNPLNGLFGTLDILDLYGEKKTKKRKKIWKEPEFIYFFLGFGLVLGRFIPLV
jgi:hypothetical protein